MTASKATFCIFNLHTGGIYRTKRTIAQINHIERNCFSASTCSRTLYFYEDMTEDKIKTFSEVMASNLDEVPIPRESWFLLRGKEAYLFALRWAAGLESNKYNRNDCFVLGKLRSHWTKFTHKKEMPSLVKLMQQLFEDASAVRSKIENEWKELSPETVYEKASQLCEEKAKIYYDSPSDKLSEDHFFQSPPRNEKELLKARKRLERKIARLTQQLDKPELSEASKLRIEKELKRASDLLVTFRQSEMHATGVTMK